MPGNDVDLEKRLADQRYVIEQQRTQIEQLLSQHEENGFLNLLKQALLGSAAAEVIGAPSSYEAALEAVLETAGEVLNANAGALFLIDDENQELIFAVALGEKSEEVKEFRVPVGQGIAGYVAATGQAISITDAERDPRFDKTIGEAIGYTPNSILCIPLFLNDQIIGVLELLDKAGGGNFTPSDMETLGRFGSLAAHTIEEARLSHDVSHLFRQLLRGEARPFEVPASSLNALSATLAIESNEDIIELAAMVHKICQQGEPSRKLAMDILGGLLSYMDAKSNT